MDIEEISGKIQRLFSGSAFGCAALAVVGLLLLIMAWIPWPLVSLLIDGGIVIFILYLRQRWIAQRRATPVYQPSAPTQIAPEEPSYRQGYRARRSFHSPIDSSPQQDFMPQPKDVSPGAIYEEPLTQYPDQI